MTEVSYKKKSVFIRLLIFTNNDAEKFCSLMMMMMMNCFCGMVDRRKAISLISSDTPQAGFEPAQNLSSGLVE